LASNGGIPAALNLWLFPSLVGGDGIFWTLDPTDFDDTLEGSNYSCKVEDVIAGRTPTINRLIISYTDLGPATFTVLLSGSDDNQQPVLFQQTVAIGTVAAPETIKTVVVGVNLTGQNLQLTIARAPGAGPVSITKIRMEGKVETTTY
jgi:hypothetical protein